jgi:hypothetical protein
MLAIFCLRLAAGMIGCLLALHPVGVPPRFYRTHFLTALCLALVASLVGPGALTPWSWVWFGLAAILCLGGVVFWSLERVTGTRVWVALTAAALFGMLFTLERTDPEAEPFGKVLVGDVTSAALLGAALSAMLMGHSYLIAPAMSLSPLMRLLTVLALATVARLAADGQALGNWTSLHSLGNLREDYLLWLPLRWGMGFLLPLILTGMAWQTARIRSTQSATGILYVVVIFCFLGELTSLLLREPGLTY